MNNIPITSSKPKETDVSFKLAQIGQRFGDLKDKIDVLEGRLTMVLKPKEQDEHPAEVKEYRVTAPLLETLQEISNNCDYLLAKVNSILDRLVL